MSQRYRDQYHSKNVVQLSPRRHNTEININFKNVVQQEMAKRRKFEINVLN